jgi:hypothetical protein
MSLHPAPEHGGGIAGVVLQDDATPVDVEALHLIAGDTRWAGRPNADEWYAVRR